MNIPPLRYLQRGYVQLSANRSTYARISCRESMPCTPAMNARFSSYVSAENFVSACWLCTSAQPDRDGRLHACFVQRFHLPLCPVSERVLLNHSMAQMGK